jgi:hypothetical protein
MPDKTLTLPPLGELTKMEAWYVECLKRWSKAHRRAPAIHELAGYCKKSPTAVYSALLSAGHKGYVQQNVERKFEVITR